MCTVFTFPKPETHRNDWIYIYIYIYIYISTSNSKRCNNHKELRHVQSTPVYTSLHQSTPATPSTPVYTIYTSLH